jgi:hypothetical protein
MLKHLTKKQINKKRLTKKQINKKRLTKRSKFVRYNKKYKNQSGGNICNLFTDKNKYVNISTIKNRKKLKKNQEGKNFSNHTYSTIEDNKGEPIYEEPIYEEPIYEEPISQKLLNIKNVHAQKLKKASKKIEAQTKQLAQNQDKYIKEKQDKYIKEYEKAKAKAEKKAQAQANAEKKQKQKQYKHKNNHE